MTTPQQLRVMHSNINVDENEIVIIYEVLDDQGSPVYNDDGSPVLATHAIRASNPRVRVRTTDRTNGQ